MKTIKLSKNILNQSFEYWVNERINLSFRVLVAFSLIVFPNWWLGNIDAINPMVLGTIACALADNDDSFEGKIKALCLTLGCFALTIISTMLLFAYPLLFGLGLVLTIFSFTMLGALGNRYSRIAQASLLISIYTMLSLEPFPSFSPEPFLLLGALSYGLISLLWCKLWPSQHIQYNLSELYLALGRYFEQISAEYYPHFHQQEIKTLDNAKENALVVDALNNTKLSLVNRIRKGTMTKANQDFLHIYFIAQDIHERASALLSLSQKDNSDLLHSDILFRLRHMLQMQAQSCTKIAKTVLCSDNYQHSLNNVIALDDLNISLSTLKAQAKNQKYINQLDTAWHNIVKVEMHFEHIDKLDDKYEFEDQSLSDTEARNISDIFARLRSQLTLNSLLVRHAIRLCLAILVGYMLIQLFQLEHGYWILLTILLVCQQNYSSTTKKLIQRIMGTFIGLSLGIPLLALFSDHNGQLVLLVIFGVLFFTFRTQNYVLSTIFITLLVMLSFNQSNSGFQVILPRMLATLIGCLISVCVVRFVLPDWQVHRMRGIMADAIEANRQYLAQVFSQFRFGKKDSLSYRQARRDAHNKDALLIQAISNMISEPGRYQSSVNESFRFLDLNHRLLSHISNLGALRQSLDNEELDQILIKRYSIIFSALNEIKNQLINQPSSDTIVLDLGDELELKNKTANKLLVHLQAIATSLPEMKELAFLLNKNILKHSKI